MSDWQKKYQEFRRNGGTIAPTPIAPNVGNFSHHRGNGEIDLTQALQARLSQKQLQHSSISSASPQTVKIKQGNQLYRSLQTGGFATGNTVLVMPVQAPQIYDKEFMVKSKRKCFVADPASMGTIDISLLENNPTILKTMVEVYAPLQGSFFVFENSLIYAHPGEKTILKG